jgi:hypothetical protein
MRGAEVSPLAQISFSKYDSAAGAKPLRDESVAQGLCSDKRKRACGGHHAVCRVYVVFDEDGNAVQWAARAPALSLSVQVFGNLECVGVDLYDGIERGAATVNLFYALKVFFREPLGRPLAGLHARLKLADGHLVQLEPLDLRRS